MSRTAAILVAASFMSVALAAAAVGQVPTYDLQVLNTPPGEPPRVWAVNDHGVVVGDYWLPNGDHPPIVIPPGGAMTFLPTLPGAISGSGLVVNNAGVIGGVSYVATAPTPQGRACLWTPTPNGYVVTALPPTPQGLEPMLVNGMNEVGDVVGTLTNGLGFVWRANTGTVDLQALVFQLVMPAMSINESRQVVGGRQRLDLDTNVVDVGVIPNASWEFLHVNDSGVCSAKSISASPFSPFFKGGTYEFGIGPTDYGAGGFSGNITGIDYAGTVAGRTSIPPVDFVHFDDFGDFPINSLLDPSASNWSVNLHSTSGMSANGRIAAFAVDNVAGVGRSVLLTPQRFHAILETVPGIDGPPVLTAEGALTGGSPITFRLKRAAASAPVALIAGVAPANLAFYGGTLVPQPTLVLTGLTTTIFGTLDLASTWPAGIPSGTKLYVQEWIADASAPFGVAGANALECVVP